MPVLRRPVEPAARTGHGPMSDLSPLSVEERKSNFGAARSVEDPERAFAIRARISNSQPVRGACRAFLTGLIDRSKAAPNMVARLGERQGQRLA